MIWGRGTSDPVLFGPVRNRQGIAADLDAVPSRLRQLILGIDALDATIRLLHPDIDLAVAKRRLTPRRQTLRGLGHVHRRS